MTHINNITEAKQVLAQTEEMVSRIEQNQWAYKMVSPEELRNSQNGFVWHIEDCEDGEFEFDAEDFSSMIAMFKEEIVLAEKILSEI